MKHIIIDAEWNPKDNDKIHVICAAEYPSGAVLRFTDLKLFADWYRSVSPQKVFIHAGLTADVPVINKAYGYEFLERSKIVDTFVVSRLVDYKKFNTHSLEELGRHLKVFKGDYEGGWDEYTEEMAVYCEQDVEVLRSIVTFLMPYIKDGTWAEAMRTEHDMATLCYVMQQNGFCFDKEKAQGILWNVMYDMAHLEAGFLKAWPPVLTVDRVLKLRYTKDGELYAPLARAMEENLTYSIDEEEETVTFYTFKAFNPGSVKDRIDKLWEAGWKPYDKTKGHAKAIREGKDTSKFEVYGWKVNEDNLKTLPKSAPEAAKNLARWLTLEGRRSSLVEYINCTSEETGRIHGKFWNIGAWTQRMSHSSPNQGNIAAVWPPEVEPKSPVEEIKAKYNSDIRSCFHVPSSSWLVGTDADGIQLRILTHYMKSEDYRTAILEGNKKDETDIHNLNKKALGYICRSRDDAKTFIYAWLLGATSPKVASILGCNIPQAAAAINNFLHAIPDLKKVKKSIIPRDARRGWFTALDNRKVKCSSEHLMMSGYLQSGEAIVMKRALLKWYPRAQATGIEFKLIDFVHDEWQTEVRGTKEQAEAIGKLQRDAIVEVGEELGLFCPLKGSTSIGKNWADSH